MMFTTCHLSLMASPPTGPADFSLVPIRFYHFIPVGATRLELTHGHVIPLREDVSASSQPTRLVSALQHGTQDPDFPIVSDCNAAHDRVPSVTSTIFCL